MGKKSFHENHFFMDKWCNFPLRILLYCRCSQLTKARREFRGLCRPHTIWTDGSRVLTYKTSAGEYFTMYVCFIHVCRRVIRYVPRTKFFLRLWVPHPLTSIENTLRDESLSLSRLLEKKSVPFFLSSFSLLPLSRCSTPGIISPSLARRLRFHERRGWVQRKLVVYCYRREIWSHL